MKVSTHIIQNANKKLKILANVLKISLYDNQYNKYKRIFFAF